MRVGTLAALYQSDVMQHLVTSGFEFIEITPPPAIDDLPEHLPDIPFIWQCPSDLPSEHENSHIRQSVLTVWRDHLTAATRLKARLLVLQFRRPTYLSGKQALYNFIDQQIALLQPITTEARHNGIQAVLRNSPDNRDQLQMLREIVRGVSGLGIALDIAYAHHQVVKNLAKEYLWDSDLGGRILHCYASDSTGTDATLRLPPGCLGSAGIPWSRLVNELRQRYNASITIDAGLAPLNYLDLSRQQWLDWWNAD